jgi:hypothetical protein
MSDAKGGVPIEQFIQALTTQLDRAQNAMALKAENLDLPLTFAVKDLSLDLRTHVEVVKSVVRIRPAAPGDVDASTLHLSLTTITKPMIRENAKAMKFDPQEQTLKDAPKKNRTGWSGLEFIPWINCAGQPNRAGEATWNGSRVCPWIDCGKLCRGHRIRRSSASSHTVTRKDSAMGVRPFCASKAEI